MINLSPRKVLTPVEIASIEGRNPSLISPFHKERCSGIGYEIALDSTVVLYPDNFRNKFLARFVPRPSQVCALTEETFSLPSNLVGSIVTKHSLVTKAVFVKGHIGSNYVGRAILEIQNRGDKVVTIQKGDLVARVILEIKNAG